MVLSVNSVSWTSTINFFAPVLILPYCSKAFTCSNTLVCHALYKLTYKIQEHAFKYFFPEIPDPFSEPSSLVVPNTPNKFEPLNSCLTTSISFLILNQIRGPALAKVLINYRLYMIELSLANFAFLTATSMVALRIYKNLYPIQKTQMTITEENLAKAKEIKSLIEKLGLAFDEQTLVEENSYLIDQVLRALPSLPIREKDNPLHIWDITETIDPLIAAATDKGEGPKCPNGCGKKLKLEGTVSTDIQDEIINLLKKKLESLESLKEV